ncbi:MAG: S53 family peptidase [Patescibacteria group bacterium]
MSQSTKHYSYIAIALVVLILAVAFKMSSQAKGNPHLQDNTQASSQASGVNGSPSLPNTPDQASGGLAIAQEASARVCAHGENNVFGCEARVIVDANGTPKANTGPVGYGPTQFHTAYNLPNTSSLSIAPIIAIVDAYDHPNILTDLNTYGQAMGIPSMTACTGTVASATGPCFKKVDQRGGTKYPAVNANWALETSMDVEVAHAICQNCRILLVEADSSSFANLMSAVDQARGLGAKIISNSYGASEFSGETTYDSHFNFLGVVNLFSSGDSGFGPSYPAGSQYVVAVGGTTLVLNSNGTYNRESVWSGAGSGCSTYENKPSWQHDANCAKRTIADVSAVADPNTGAAVYDSVKMQGQSGWFKVGGTSLSAPLVAGVYGLGATFTGLAGADLYSKVLATPSILRDVLTGSNGTCGNYLCTGTAGYDGPTGLGTPFGVGAF